MSKDAIQAAINLFGSRQKLADELGVSLSAIATALKRGWVTRVWAIAIANITKGKLNEDDFTIGPSKEVA